MKHIKLNVQAFEKKDLRRKMQEKCMHRVCTWIERQSQAPVLGATLVFEIVEDNE